MKRISRKTKQKEIIEKTAKSFTHFFTAQELFEKVKKKEDKIGIATVYRFLADLEEKHEIHQFMCNRQKLFSFNQHSHAHFKCEQCNKTTHLKIPDLTFLKKVTKQKICHVQIDINGICSNCENK